jgi:hypothetical protein
MMSTVRSKSDVLLVGRRTAAVGTVFAAITILLVAAIPSPSEAAHRAGGRSYDGSWSVAIYTMRGDCGSVRAALQISGGRVYSGDATYQANGAVGAGGAIRVTVMQGGQSAGGVGHLRGNAGRGWWRTASGQCAGQWTAERRFANY